MSGQRTRCVSAYTCNLYSGTQKEDHHSSIFLESGDLGTAAYRHSSGATTHVRYGLNMADAPRSSRRGTGRLASESYDTFAAADRTFSREPRCG